VLLLALLMLLLLNTRWPWLIKAVHSALEDAMQNLRNGTVQLGRARELTDEPEQARDLTRFGERRLQLEFSALPDPALPEK
ncbi:MAG: hypothetical protein P8178_16315, partial [Candidatus Thiodiazotropha sp.]